MKDEFFTGTIHPAVIVSLFIFIVLFLAALVIISLQLPFDDSNVGVLSVVGSLLCSGLLYFTYRMRTIKFDGREFILEDVRSRETRIAASYFHSISALLGPSSRMYKISFTDGRRYFYMYRELDEVFKREVLFSNESAAYCVRLTKQIKHVIEAENILVKKETSLKRITPGKTQELYARLLDAYGTNLRPEKLTIQYPDEPFTSRMLRRDIETMEREQLTLEQAFTLMSHLHLLSNEGLLYLLLAMIQQINHATTDYSVLYNRLENVIKQSPSANEQRVLEQTVDFLKDCENVMGMEW